MISPRRLSIPILLSAGMLLAATLACDFNFETREPSIITYDQHYSIDPPSLLRSTSQNGDTPFTPIDDRPELPPPDQQIPVDWKQADYLQIANALFEDIWGETTDGWSLNSIFFALGCTKIDNGFQNASFQYFRNEKTEEDSRIVRFIHIDPRNKSVYVTERIYSPRLADWGFIDLKRLNFSADDVLVLAENNGGKEKRLSVDNVCEITLLLLSPNSPSYRGWNVRYSNSDIVNLFEINVDPITGEIMSQ
ncbi:MAG: hypothetical protein ACOYYF_03510 [Chloroflexota bacterium]|nr:hypothetical protein [Chloroflexota bacterium]MBI5703742.1 hypothetical protein [Chloroflexota bacterium]